MDAVKYWFSGSAGQEDKLQQLKRKVRTLQARAEDISSEVEQEELRPGKRRKREVDNWLKDVNEVVNQLQRLELRGKELGSPTWGSSSSTIQTSLTEHIGELIQQGSFPQGFTLYDHGSSSVALVTATTKVNDNTLHDNKKKVLSWLLDDDSISTIGVYGPGGVGKTMLLKEIHNELFEHFKTSRRIYWISVSHGISLPMLQDKIAEAMDLTYLLKEKDAIRKTASLCHELKQRKNAVLFLDDVWEHFSLEEVGIPENCCKVILTTRSLDVCRRMECQEVIKVEPLTEENAWLLFARVLGWRDQIPSEVNELAKLVAAECAGLPLGLIVMAGSMRGVEGVEEWRNTLEELQNSSEGQSDIETDIFPVLKLSYDRLQDAKLRQCFLLCALYPKYGEIERDELIMLFRVEGLLDTIQGWQKQFDKGHSILNKLENVCLLEKHGSTRVKMHNFVRDMAIRITNVMPRFMISAGAELRRIPSGRRWTIDLDKASLMQNALSEILPGTIPMCPCLTTLLLQNNPFTKLPDSFFVHMKSLKVLNLSRTSIKVLPNSISELETLRALLLEFCTRLHFVPSLVKLTRLRNLDFSFCWSMNGVPHGLDQLADLRFLDLGGSKNLCRLLSMSLSTLSSIQCLKLDPDVQIISGDDMVKLRYLERVEGCRISTVSDFNRYVATQHFQQLKYYEFVVGPGEYKKVDYSISQERMVILCSGNLRGGSEGFVLPTNTQDLQIHNSELGARSLVDALPSFIHLTELKKILIRRCRAIEVMWSPQSCVEAEQETVLLFQCLKELILTDLHDFRGLVKEGVSLQRGVFFNLTTLVIKYCPKIKKLFTSNLLNGNLDNLQELEVEGCEELEQIIASDEDDDYQQRSIDLTRLPNLRVLQLKRLPKLTSICHEGLLGKGSIEQINVEYCEKIKQILMNNLPQDHMRNLKEVKVVGCESLQEIFALTNNQSQENGKYELPNLKTLELDDLPCLTGFFHGNIPTCGSIEQITVRICPGLKRLPLSIPLVSNGEQLAPLFLQQIKTDRKWWESLEWDDPSIKRILLPLTKLREASESSFSVLEGELQIPVNKFSKTKVDSTYMRSCLTISRLCLRSFFFLPFVSHIRLFN